MSDALLNPGRWPEHSQACSSHGRILQVHRDDATFLERLEMLTGAEGRCVRCYGKEAGTSGTLPLSSKETWAVPKGKTWGAVPKGKKKSPVYDYYVAEFDDSGKGKALPAYVCIHAGHHGRPDARIRRNGTTTNLLRHLKDQHRVDLKEHIGVDNIARGGAAVHCGGTSAKPSRYQPTISSYTTMSAAPYSAKHPIQLRFLESQVDMIVDTLSPESIVENRASLK
jgi:hypothetical protein